MFNLIIASFLISCILESIGVPVDVKLLIPTPELQAEINQVNVQEKNSKIDENITRVTNSGVRTGPFFLSHFPSTWYAAKVYCETAGMQLLSIETPSKNLNAISVLESAGVQSIWTSGTDAARDGFYVWASTGEIPFNYPYWITNEAPKNAAKNCVFLGTNSFWEDSGIARAGWFVEDCSISAHFICE